MVTDETPIDGEREEIMIDMAEFHILAAEASLTIGRLRGLFRMLSIAAQSAVEIDNETLTAAGDNGLAAACDAKQALERLLAQVFSRDRAA
jgi:hypothetical protein